MIKTDSSLSLIDVDIRLLVSKLKTNKNLSLIKTERNLLGFISDKNRSKCIVDTIS